MAAIAAPTARVEKRHRFEWRPMSVRPPLGVGFGLRIVADLDDLLDKHSNLRPDPGWDHVMSGAAAWEFWLERDGVPGGADLVWQPHRGVGGWWGVMASLPMPWLSGAAR